MTLAEPTLSRTNLVGLFTSSAVKAVISIGMLAAAVAILASNYDLAVVAADLRRLNALTIVLVIVALLANAIFAVIRFKVIASDMGHSLSLRQAMVTVSAGSLAGALFFQLAGQLIARGAILGRGGVPFANVVVITLYERVVAAIVSALVAVAGAYLVFGRIYVDPQTGGADLIKLVLGLIAAVTLAAIIGFGRAAAKSVLPLISENFTRSIFRVLVLTLIVQAPIMVAYVVVAHALSPNVSLLDIAAATAIVMFAASVPISLAGWGVREMSAVAALGFIGVSGPAAFTTAIIVGAGSLASMAVIAAASLLGGAKAEKTMEKQAEQPMSGLSVDYTQALAWVLPLAAATLVLFQIYIPVGSGTLNVNLADPIALIAASLFILSAFVTRRMPQWRTPRFNMAVGLATLALTVSLLIGIGTFGVTTWAWVNRYLGWFVLLAYGATGALIVHRGGKDGLRIVLLSYVGATIAVTALDLVIVFLKVLGYDFSHKIDIEGFSQNHNFFAFQLLMAISAIAVFAKGMRLRLVLISVVMVAFWFSGSRSGWIAVFIVLGLGIYLRTISIRETAIALGVTAVVTLAPFLTHVTTYKTIPRDAAEQSTMPVTAAPKIVPGPVRRIAPEIIPSGASTHERMVTIIGGWELFKENPLFGAGLGAFRNQMIFSSTTGVPLLIHSTALWLLAELGAVGFLVFAIPAVMLFVQEWRRSSDDDTSKFIVLCCVAFAVMAGPADMLYQRTFWLVMGAALALPPEAARATASG